ncbi:MAG TPA: tRNA uridine-5-carboxymethylaminomethyl(34) synthesis GTPase MnmE [Elusimicrobiota bacterium]|jgi:tRNA modification GTPase|nr:tRNA uridine-5-carboxymethylaminomethyl(34) synthesis GTPase MnmE [Elusimicrobiota bacterium]
MSDTIVAPATPPGRGALGVVRVSGPGARAVARELLGCASLEPRRAAARTARRAGRPVDRVVAVFWEAPETPTGEDLLELTAHGSPEILRELVAAAIDAGARPAEPGEFTRRAFVNGRLDLAQAEAVEALIRARGESARRAALDRLEGGLSRAVAAVRAPILDRLALLEARLDHPDEDIPPLSDAAADAAFAALRAPLERLLAAFDRGRAEREGLRVCLVGRPNAGKSSLLNALLGRDRAIVAATPGTTRDTLSEPAVLDGLPAVLVDTAGLRDDASDPAEREGVARAERALAACDVAVLVVDSARPEDDADARAHRRALELAAKEGRPVVVARSKSDLAARAGASGGISVSARTGAGLAALASAVAAAASAAPNGDEGEALLVGTRDRDAFAAALAELDAARAAVADHPGVWEDRAACHLREAHALLGRVVGEGAPDEVLAAVFSRFCVGK